MIDQHSAISSQQSTLNGNAYQPGDNAHKPEMGNRLADVNDHKEEYKKVAKEMESLFAFQLLKIMRETTGSMSDEKKENGYDTYMGLFDMEVSKLLADRGLGLQESIINWLERSPGVNQDDFSSKE
jgi:Rod binding domain-containing protein